MTAVIKASISSEAPMATALPPASPRTPAPIAQGNAIAPAQQAAQAASPIAAINLLFMSFDPLLISDLHWSPCNPYMLKQLEEQAQNASTQHR
jgi:hypothetical protein